MGLTLLYSCKFFETEESADSELAATKSVSEFPDFYNTTKINAVIAKNLAEIQKCKGSNKPPKITLTEMRIKVHRDRSPYSFEIVNAYATKLIYLSGKNQIQYLRVDRFATTPPSQSLRPGLIEVGVAGAVNGFFDAKVFRSGQASGASESFFVLAERGTGEKGFNIGGHSRDFTCGQLK
jgi:hypothetical protein